MQSSTRIERAPEVFISERLELHACKVLVCSNAKTKKHPLANIIETRTAEDKFSKK
jgi:hypothetical protein